MCIPRTLSFPERQPSLLVFVLLSDCNVPYPDIQEFSPLRKFVETIGWLQLVMASACLYYY